MKKKILKQIIWLSIIGIGVAGYLLYIFYGSGNQICDINSKFSCTTVKDSTFSEFVGVPTALIGMVGYVGIGLISFLRYHKRKYLQSRTMKKVFSQHNLFYLTSIGLLFSLYLTYAEVFIIKAFCVFCIISLVIIGLITYLTYKNVKIKIEED